jgi:hypothetical protein
MRLGILVSGTIRCMKDFPMRYQTLEIYGLTAVNHPKSMSVRLWSIHLSKVIQFSRAARGSHHGMVQLGKQKKDESDFPVVSVQVDPSYLGALDNRTKT